tara:strand:- start:198 stop:728 length:531 start_codon:yes stop_codon:yes gene_type:complete
MEPINVEFEWKLSDYHEAQNLFLGARRTLLMVLRGLSIGVCGLTLALLIVGMGLKDAWRDSELLGISFGLLALLSFWVALPRIQKFLQYRFFKLDRLEGKALSYRISEDDIFMCGPDAESKVKWTHFNRWMEGRSLFVMMAGRLMYMVPKDRLGDRVEDLRGLLTEKIGPQGKTRK